MRPSQTDQPLFSVGFAVILSRKHRPIKRFHAAGQIHVVLAQVLSALVGVVAHALLLYMHYFCFASAGPAILVSVAIETLLALGYIWILATERKVAGGG
jgi:hypothetical protein